VRAGRRLGVDVGDVRIGLASCDPSGLVATPLETVPAGETALQRIAEHVDAEEAVEVVVGLPRSLSGGEGPAAAKARGFAEALTTHLRVTGRAAAVRLVDERLSTVTAEAQLRAGGRKGKNRRAVVDQAAAVVILQNALDTERASGRPPGEPVPPPDGADRAEKG
jgi:putative holliday junction resolvase